MSRELDEQAVDAALRELFGEPPFSGAAGSGAPTADDIIGAVLAWYETLIGDLYVASPTAFWLAFGSCAAVVVLLAWRLGAALAALWQALAPRRRAAPQGRTVDVRPAVRAALQAMAAGDHRAAVELAWSAVAFAFDAAPPEPSHSPRQQARRLRPLFTDEHRRILYRLVATHERTCYAGLPPHRALAESAVRDALTLLSAGDG